MRSRNQTVYADVTLKNCCAPPMPSYERVIFIYSFSIGSPNSEEIHAETRIRRIRRCGPPARLPIAAARSSHTTDAISLGEGSVTFDEWCVFTSTHSTYDILRLTVPLKVWKHTPRLFVRSGMSREQAVAQVQRELLQYTRDPIIPGCAISPDDADVLHWTVMLPGPAGTPYEGGLFFLNACFPEDYPRLYFSSHCSTHLSRFSPKGQLHNYHLSSSSQHGRWQDLHSHP